MAVKEARPVLWISIPHAAQLIGISARCVRYAIARGQVRAKKTDHGYWLVHRGSAEEYRDDPQLAAKRAEAKAVAALVKRRARDAAKRQAAATASRRRLKAKLRKS